MVLSKAESIHTEIKNDQKVFRWTSNSEMWDCDNCTVNAVKISENETRVVIRSSHKVHSGYRKKIVELKYMLVFDITDIQQSKSENYHQLQKDNVKNKTYRPPRKIWVFQIDSEYWIWQWAEDRKSLQEREVYKIYELLTKVQSTPYPGRKSIFNANVHVDVRNDTMIPIIYPTSNRFLEKFRSRNPLP